MQPGEPALYTPINRLKPVHDDLWIVDGPVVRMAVPGGSFPFPTRMVIVRLRSGGLWCHSPTALTPELREQVDALGPVRHLVSPNKLHYAFIPDWSRAYPDAVRWAAPGVRERAARQHIAVDFDEELTDSAPAAWAEDIDQLIFRGSRVLQEVVFFHRPSATLLLADLIENFERDRMPKGLHWLLRLAGCLDPDGKAPWDMRMTFLRGRSAARQCLARVLAWRPRTVILAHGRWYAENGSTELRRAFRWLN